MNTPQTQTRHLAENLGPQCACCRQTEARCAWLRGCCSTCSHWVGFTPNGEHVHGNTAAALIRDLLEAV